VGPRVGAREVGRYAADADVGEAVRWDEERKTAWRLVDGEEQEEVSLTEAAAIAARVGLPVPR